MRRARECLTGAARRGRGRASSRNRAGAAGGRGLGVGRGSARAGPRVGRDTTTASGGRGGAGHREGVEINFNS